jgi:CubicO group peptidase (beta-lactamase class C family)
MNDLKFAFRQLLNKPSFTASVLLALAGASPCAAQVQPAHDQSNKVDFSKARQFIQEYMTERSIPSIAVAVARRGEILWEEGFGWADRENRIPATEHTMYYMASVDKSFTAMALMILQERKQLDLDRPVNDYLGAAKLNSPAWNPAEATVRRVANHTAGLTTFNPRNPLSMDETIHRYGVLFWPPGEHFDYSNLGFKILDDVVARVSGNSYSNFLRAEIFWPLGMTHASVGIGPGLEKFIAQRYDTTSGLRPPRGGGVYCSAHDLARFGMFCLKAHLRDQKRILSDAAIDRMYDSPVSMGAGETKYSLGWSIDENLYGYRGILAQGGTSAAQAWLRLIASEDLAVVALANHGAMSSKVVHEIVSALLPPYAEKHAKTEAKPKAPETAASLPGPELVGNWAGIVRTYRADIPLRLSVAKSGDVHAKLGTQLTTLLNDARFEKQRLRGRMSGDLGVEEDTGPDRYHLSFFLDLRDGALKGAVETAPSPNLAFWVELKKQNETGAARN